MKSIYTAAILILFGLLGIVNAQQSTTDGKDMLNEKQRRIVTVSAYTAKGDLERLKVALDARMSINEIKEVLVHLYAYCGFPRSIRGIQTFMEVLDERKAKGITDQRRPQQQV